MAISKSNSIVHSLSGMFGKEIVFRYVNGKTIVSSPPDFSNVTWSEKQKDHRARFREAALKAKTLAADPEIRKKYEKKLKPGYTVYNVILKELMG
jgi:hypothetical protein